MVESHRSAYVPAVTFRSDAERKAIKPLVEAKVSAFFGARGIANPRMIEPKDAITDLDFDRNRPDGRKAIRFRYMYNVVMNGAKKVDGRIQHTGYTLTFDHALTPEKCNDTGIYFGSLNLAGKPVLYYIRLDLAELIKKVRQAEFIP